MRRERQILADRIIELNGRLDRYENLYDRELITEWEFYQQQKELIPALSEVESDFLNTYAEEPWGRPTWAANLGAYDQYQRDNAAGIYR